MLSNPRCGDALLGAVACVPYKTCVLELCRSLEEFFAPVGLGWCFAQGGGESVAVTRPDDAASRDLSLFHMQGTNSGVRQLCTALQSQ